MNEINITSAKYVADDTGNISVIATIDGVEWGVPMSEGNRHYAEILRQVEAGTLTIADAD
tara:strand:- start:477 stop:656 length:180 start_codon:yes stop_codon:yes gene_type:complete